MQDGTHVMVQRAAQLEIDLDQTAAMLCDELDHSAERDATIAKLEAHKYFEQEHNRMAMATVSSLSYQLCAKDQALQSSNQQLGVTLVSCLFYTNSQAAYFSTQHSHNLSVWHACLRFFPWQVFSDT